MPANGPESERSSAPGEAARRARVLARLEELEGELARVRSEFLALSPGEPIPRAHLLVEACGYRALVPTSLVAEVVRLVETVASPDSPPQVLGTFVWRGRGVTAIDLAWYVAGPREPPLESHVLVFAGARSFALVVDAVRAIVPSPTLVSADAGGAPDPWAARGLAAGTCRVDGEIVPLLGLGPVLEALAATKAGAPAATGAGAAGAESPTGTGPGSDDS